MRKSKKPATGKRFGSGRARLAAEHLRSVRLVFRATPAEARSVAARAARSGLERSEFLRAMALGRRLPPPGVPAINLRAILELARLGNNLNQAVKLVHQGRLSPRIEAILLELLAAIDATRASLRERREGADL